ncbi:sialidase family protein [Candidatus Rhabdochlamydia sp. T3358]|uniref:sialidase family protein n=1 Tax=Candidatus Rhabdochlamydia sp. T3358 TaxID=2099795 RepID=UPI0010B7DA22|nr:sialidase family protein [Candidatus Rhabdochlamydia sp. T3358]VHN99549.1 BNR/Asp-box repeat protein [Candidatus Rhabdochlamydia sp. T3358]
MKQIIKKCGCFFFMIAFSLLLQATPSCIIKQEFIFQDAPFASCHAATLTQTDSGALLCAWFGGTNEGANDVAIWLSVLNQEWSCPKKIALEKDIPSWNPVLFTMPNKEVILFYRAGRNPQQWSSLLKRSYDEGQSWTEAQMLPAGVIGPVKNKPLLLADGTLLCGSSIESWKLWGCWVDITSDAGHTWSKSTPINVNSQLFGIIQPTLFLTKDGVIKLLARSYQIGHICSAESYDGGKTWSAAQPIDLPNPNSGIDAVRLIDDRVALVYNHSKEDRFPLNVAISNDEGKTWEMKLVLEENPGEYSYPSIIQTKDEKIHIVYTWNRKKIKHVVVDPSLL